MARILVMEDEENIRFVLKTALAMAGHEIVAVSDGMFGMEELKQGVEPDVVLVDLRMPRLDGRAVVEKMRDESALNRIPVVIMSGSMDCSQEYPPENLYCAKITKPFDLIEVIDTVASLLNRDACKLHNPP